MYKKNNKPTQLKTAAAESQRSQNTNGPAPAAQFNDNRPPSKAAKILSGLRAAQHNTNLGKHSNFNSSYTDAGEQETHHLDESPVLDNQASSKPLQKIANEAAGTGQGPNESDSLSIKGLSKSDFLNTLQNKVAEAGDQLLAEIDQNSDDCPYIKKWFAYYSEKDVPHIEEAIRLFAPATSEAADQESYLSAIVERVKSGLANHIKSGSIDDVPDEIVDVEHQPDDFQHIANQLETAQLSKLCGSGSNEDSGSPSEDYSEIYNNAQVISDNYPNVRGFINENGDHQIIKKFTGDEANFFNAMSGTPGFPICYGDDGTYVIIEFIGDWPEPAPQVVGNDIIANMGQAAALCKVMADNGISHGDLNNNILFFQGQLVVIDFGASKSTSAKQALTDNVYYINFFLSNTEQVQFKDIIDNL